MLRTPVESRVLAGLPGSSTSGIDGTPSTPVYTQAWNDGASARIEGLPIVTCPHHTDTSVSKSLRANWIDGWKHAHLNWGCDVGGRWPIRILPLVLRRAAS
jgi:ribosome modulation factor